ncbi:MAG: hypothetical protein Q7U33_10940, partial [Methylotenera sp.]|uniref:metallophosphoesterase family protein n=1 Tax=Methylotenera sp. TaxID=2051956 RepID=UPI002728451E
DLEAEKPLEQELANVLELTEVYFIHGNHDSEKKINHDNLFNSALADRNLHGHITEIDGHRVAGLGGIFRPEIWWPVPADADPVHASYEKFENHIKSKVAYHQMLQEVADNQLMQHKGSIFHNDYEYLFCQEADILVAHEAPTCHPYGHNAVDNLAQAMKVKQSFHGHHHDRLDYRSHDKKFGFSAYGVGLQGVSDIDGNMIKEGALDTHKGKLNRSKS